MKGYAGTRKQRRRRSCRRNLGRWWRRKLRLLRSPWFRALLGPEFGLRQLFAGALE